jgi:hypothetical protein
MKNSALRLSIYVLVSFVWMSGQSVMAQENILLASAARTSPKDEVIITAGDLIEKQHQHDEPEDEPKPALTFSGSVDTYFHSSFKTKNYYYDDAYAPSTSFADLKGFSIGMVNLITSYAGEKAGFTADLVFGPRGQAAVFGAASGQAIINQAYVFYNFSDKVTLNVGQFNTFLGYEVISPAVNFHYSTSYLFSWGPFNHTGARLDFALDKGFVAKLAVMNPTDLVEFNPVNTYTLGAQIGKTSDAGGIWLNFLYGDQDGKLVSDEALPGETSAGKLFQADVTLGYNLSDVFYLGFNASLQSVGAGEEVDDNGNIAKTAAPTSSFLGFAVYPELSLSKNFALGLRAEYFSIKHNHLGIIGLDENGDGGVMEFTLSGNYKVGNLTFIPEIRLDKTTENSFYNGTTPKDTMASINLAAVYKF